MARLSSLVPKSDCVLESTIMIHNLMPTSFGFELRIKWSKTMQNSANGLRIPIVRFGSDSDLCPAVVLSKVILALIPCNPKETPLFSWKVAKNGKQCFRFFTVSMARSWLAKISQLAGFQQHRLTFHSFRRGACQLAYRKGVELQDIK